MKGCYSKQKGTVTRIGSSELPVQNINYTCIRDLYGVSQVALEVKKPLPMQETQETRIESPGQEDFPGEGNGNQFQSSCLESSMGRGAWQVHWATESQT